MLKKCLFILFSSLIFFFYIKGQLEETKSANDKIVIDKILAIIYHPEGNSIILQSDLRPSLSGVPKTLNDIIFERLMVLDAENLKIVVTDSDVDRHLALVQKQFKLSKEDTIELFKQIGLTYDKARETLKNDLKIQKVLDYRVKNKVIIDKKKIEEYYDKNPVYEPATFTFVQSFVSFEGRSPALTKIKIERAIESNEIDKEVVWGETLTLREDQIAQDKAFIKDLVINRPTIVNVFDNGLSLIKLLSKTASKLVPLKDREAEIYNILGQKEFESILQEYKKKLISLAPIKFTNNEDKKLFALAG